MNTRIPLVLRTAGCAFALVVAGAVASPISAQEATETATTATTTAQVETTTPVTREEEGGFDDWGLLGLLGLGGLLRRPARAVIVDPTPTGTRRP